MFTGLVREIGIVRSAVDRGEARVFAIASTLGPDELDLGASVAVGGVCLTVTGGDAGIFTVEAAFETLSRTAMSRLESGARVNLEPALRVGDPLGGHLVSGHVDGVGEVRSIEARGDAREVRFGFPSSLSRYVAEKGSICVDGVSLTVNTVDHDTFTVGLIPHTLSVTTLGDLGVGDRVNLEVDLIARYLARLYETSRAQESA